MATVASGDKSARIKANKERYKAKCAAELAKRKAWRIRTYGHTPTGDLTRGTLELFAKWGVRKEECKSAIKMKKFKRPEKKRTGFTGHWE